MSNENDIRSSKKCEIKKEIIPIRFYIYVHYKGEMKPILDQPIDGFEERKYAVLHLFRLINAKKGEYFTRNWYRFTIQETFHSLSAV